MGIIKPIKSKLDYAYKSLSNINANLDIEDPDINSKLKLRYQELESLQQELLQIDKKIVLEKKIRDDILSGKMLGDFLQSKVADENYSRNLGMISLIRKDFCRLDELLRNQHLSKDEDPNEQSEIQLQIDRIILYIDDLDRCNEDVVVRVLEAIHLLLAFPIFVVVVGVDPRWLNNALSQKYKNLLGKPDNIENTGSSPLWNKFSATSYDYLEKIFQIPFSIKSINEAGRNNLIDNLVRKELEQEVTPQTIAPNINPSSNPVNGLPSSNPIDKNKDFISQTVQNYELKPLTFSSQEISFIKKMSTIFGITPRTINRFLNIYRILKSHRSLALNKNLTNKYSPTIFSLGIIIGLPDYSQIFVNNIFSSKNEMPLSGFIHSCEEFPLGVKTIIKRVIDEELGSIQMSNFKQNIGLISRFSFRYIDLEQN